ncbi:ABC transporter ATP-binding protein [Streptomyces sp. NPDC001443]
MTDDTVLVARNLGKRYRRRWALSDCTLAVPAGRVVGLVGPNGAGKSTLLRLAVGLIPPTAGEVEVLGGRPATDPAQLARVGFVAQDTPAYAQLTVADHLRLGGRLNPRWDAGLAERRIAASGLDPRQRAGRLSGGQRAQLALALAVAKRPELLVLDEPVASLDPLARRDFLHGVSEIASGQGVSVVLSSHLVADLERICDYVIVLVASRVRVAGTVEELQATHHRLTGPRHLDVTAVRGVTAARVVEARDTGDHSIVLVRSEAPVDHPDWESAPAGLEDIVLAYMGTADTASETRS